MQDTLNTVAVGIIATVTSFAVRKFKMIERFRGSEKKKLIILGLCLLSMIVVGLLVTYSELRSQVRYVSEPIFNNAMSHGLTLVVATAMPHADCIKNALINGFGQCMSGCSQGAEACAKTVRSIGATVQGQIQDCMAHKRADKEEAPKAERNSRPAQTCSKQS